MKKISFLAIFLLGAILGWAQNVATQTEKSHTGVKVEMGTNQGKIVLLLYDETPKHRDNFLKLVENGTYNGLLFHRVIQRFMIQGGDPDSKGAPKGKMLGDGTLGYNIPAEIVPGLYHKRGALCAAREGDDVNPMKESSSSQFYIVQGNVWDDKTLDAMEQRFNKRFNEEQRRLYSTVGGAPHLDGDYTVYGEVLEGMDVVDRIAATPCDRFDRPIEDMVIEYVKVIK